MGDLTKNLVKPYGGNLVDLVSRDGALEDLHSEVQNLPKIRLTNRNVCDLELLATGAFSPLDRFLGKDDYHSVVKTMSLADGTLFPIPLTLSVDTVEAIKLDSKCALIDQYNNVLGTMMVEEIYQADLEKEAKVVCGTTDGRHPLVAEMGSWGRFNLSGRLTIANLPRHYDFREFRLTPQQVRSRLESAGNQRVVAFQTRNPLHRAHEEMTKRAVDEIDGTLLLHPVVGITQPGDIGHHARVRSYKTLVENHYQNCKVVLSILPLAMRMAGPREALWHAIIRRNFGANHLIVGRHHASPRSPSKQDAFYGEYEAHELVSKYEKELGVKAILYSEFVYVADENRYEEINKISKNKKYFSLSGTFLRDKLEKDEEIPEWFMRPETIDDLRDAFPPKRKQGFCVWLTGLSGAGKSTISNSLIPQLLACGRKVTLLDGDNVRLHLSKGLGFSKEDREINVKRIGFVAAEIVKHGGAVVCAAISPHASVRKECREMIGESNFIEAFVDTPLDVCEERDTKGLYSEARKGAIKDFTGIDSPYEAPSNPELRITTVDKTPEESAKLILGYLEQRGLVVGK